MADKTSVAVLGAPTSGKTTFLAALSIALAQRDDDWRVIGADTSSRERLVELTRDLAARSFPEPTAGIDQFRWMLVGTALRTVQGRWFKRQQERTAMIGLDFADPSGEIATDHRRHAYRDSLIASLIGSRGIVFLFDPIIEFEQGETFAHTFGIIAELAQRMLESNDLVDGYLPHYVAVCISKFDEYKVLRSAERLKLVTLDTSDARGFPRVEDDDAREFFAHLCKVSRSGNADLVLKTIERHFRPDRIRYFVTSAIGFYLDPGTDTFDAKDYQNRLPPDSQDHSKARIRGPIHPINVVEPLLWLSERLTGDS